MTPDGTSPSPAAAPPADAYVTFSPKLLAMESPAKSPAAIAIHEMAGQLIVQQVDRGRRGVAVCASGRGAGTTLIAANLAIAISRAGVSVLLVDGNLHDAGLEQLISPSTPVDGLQQVLRSQDLSPADAILPEILPGLSILFAGGACADASELIGGVLCGDMLASTLRDYDYTIVDTPPANRSPDARRLASHVGYSLIVARRNRTYVDDLATLAGELAQDRAEVIGTIFNAA
jgi:Mrp family chromosome partitioning ATPase